MPTPAQIRNRRYKKLRELRNSGFFSEDAIKLRHVNIPSLSPCSIIPTWEITRRDRLDSRILTAHSVSFYRKISSISNTGKSSLRSQIKKQKTNASLKKMTKKIIGRFQKKWQEKLHLQKKGSAIVRLYKIGKLFKNSRSNSKRKI